MTVRSDYFGRQPEIEGVTRTGRTVLSDEDGRMSYGSCRSSVSIDRRGLGTAAAALAANMDHPLCRGSVNAESGAFENLKKSCGMHSNGSICSESTEAACERRPMSRALEHRS